MVGIRKLLRTRLNICSDTFPWAALESLRHGQLAQLPNFAGAKVSTNRTFDQGRQAYPNP